MIGSFITVDFLFFFGIESVVHPNTNMDRVRSDTITPMVTYLQILRILFIDVRTLKKDSNKRIWNVKHGTRGVHD